MKTFEQVLEELPQLTAFGIGVFWTHRHRVGEFEKERQALVSAKARVQEIAQWVFRNLEPQKGINTKHTSYGYKHIAEREIGYVANGEFIAAAVMVGFRYKLTPDFPNVKFNFTERSIKVAEERLCR
jgi:hypothetical protein